jgi:hypothetical protein
MSTDVHTGNQCAIINREGNFYIAMIAYPLGPPINELELRSFLRDRLRMPQTLDSLPFSHLVAVFAVLVLVSLESNYQYKEL